MEIKTIRGGEPDNYGEIWKERYISKVSRYHKTRKIFYILEMIFLVTTICTIIANFMSTEPKLVLAIICGVSSFSLVLCSFLAFYFNNKLKLKNLLRL